MRDYGYRDVTAAVVREIDEGPSTEKRQGVISMFAARELEKARDAGLLHRVAAAAARPPRSLDVE